MAANAAQASLHGRRAVARGGRRQFREVLKLVGARVGVSRVVRRHALGREIDPEPAVAADEVAEDRVARAGFGEDTGAAVEGDRVAATGGGPADLVVVSAVLDSDAVAGVCERGRPGRVRSDPVPLHDVSGRRGVRDPNAVDGVTGDDVARPGALSADHVVVGAVVDLDPVVAVAVGGAGGAYADEIASNEISGAAAAKPDPVGAVAAHEVAVGRRDSPDLVVVAFRDENAVAGVAEIRRSRLVGAYEVPQHEIAAGAVEEQDSVPAVPDDPISGDRVSGSGVDLNSLAAVAERLAAGTRLDSDGV